MPDTPWLRELWQSLFSASDAEACRRIEQRLLDAYDEPHRAYHTLSHVEAMLRLVPSMTQDLRKQRLLQMATFFHDVVYDPEDLHDNELRSAQWACEALQDLAVDEETTHTVERLVLATRTHQAEDTLMGRFLDMDLSVLSAPEDEYDRYAAAIRQEYAWVPEAAYRHERARLLESFLQRPRLYHTPEFRAQREARARANLQREIDQLRR